MNNILIPLMLLIITVNCSTDSDQKNFSASEQHILTCKKHRLTFTGYDPPDTMADQTKTNARLNNTKIIIILDDIKLGAGSEGMGNFESMLAKLPDGSEITAVHYLICEDNQWAARVRQLRDKYAKKGNIRISCDGAF